MSLLQELAGKFIGRLNVSPFITVPRSIAIVGQIGEVERIRGVELVRSAETDVCLFSVGGVFKSKEMVRPGRVWFAGNQVDQIVYRLVNAPPVSQQDSLARASSVVSPFFAIASSRMPIPSEYRERSSRRLARSRAAEIFCGLTESAARKLVSAFSTSPSCCRA